MVAAPEGATIRTFLETVCLAAASLRDTVVAEAALGVAVRSRVVRA